MKHKHRLVVSVCLCAIIYVVCNIYINARVSENILQKTLNDETLINKRNEKKASAKRARKIPLENNIPKLKDFDRFDLIDGMNFRNKMPSSLKQLHIK